MTYLGLLNQLKALSPEQLNQDVTVHLTEVDEFIPVYTLSLAVEDDNDVLDPGHIVLGS